MDRIATLCLVYAVDAQRFDGQSLVQYRLRVRRRGCIMDISPDKQNIDRVFSGTVYSIDFYQRDYRWTDEPVLRLLDDIFFKFNERYARHKELDPSVETITAYYPWYYLNTYVTNLVDGRVYVVDGQQRLTT